VKLLIERVDVSPDGVVSAPDDAPNTWAPPRRRIDNAMVTAIARAFRWR
jgi:hypothetical protein